MDIKWVPGVHPRDDIVVIKTPRLRGPVHDWFIIPKWLDVMLHIENVEHTHKGDE